MSKGNINYKYLRRRKSWFRRNIPLVIMWAGDNGGKRGGMD